jgi:hypothetical protein
LDGSNWTETVKLAFSVVIFLLAFTMYICKDIFRGQSVGKWLLGIEIKDEEDIECVPSKGRLILRNLTILLRQLFFNPNYSARERERYNCKN